MQWELSYLRPRSCAKYKQTLFKNLPKHYPKHPENPASYGTPFRIHWIFLNNWLKFYLFTYLFFLAAFGSSLLCAASLGAVSGGLLFVGMRGPLAAGHRPQAHGLWPPQQAGSVIAAHGLLLRSMWNHPRPEVEPVSPAPASGFLPLWYQASPMTIIINAFPRLFFS